MSHLPLRFRDPGLFLEAMQDEILIVCPRCAACAQIVRLAGLPNGRGPLPVRRVICASCGYVREGGSPGGRDNGTATVCDSGFGLPLWFQTPCCGQTLWAYNRRHLHLIEQWVRAGLREHRPDPVSGWRNSSLINRLPEWMIVAKHREAVLRAIAKLSHKV